MAYDDKAKPGSKAPGAKPRADKLDMSLVRKRYSRALEAERDNAEAAIDDLAFRAGDQWDARMLERRQAENRPALVINRIPQFVRQITGDIRQLRPSIKVYGVDDYGDRDKAQVIQDVIRYIENRSDATDAYFNAVDQQVTAGVGHWRVSTEYAGDETFDQDIRIERVDDGIGVLWDPDATRADRSDAMFCFVPIDMTFEAFKEKYPDARAAGFDDLAEYAKSFGDEDTWSRGDTIRIAEYWIKKPSKLQMVKPDGTLATREVFKVCRYIVTGAEVLEGPTDWPGKHIPIVRIAGEEVRIGPRVYRHGVTRYLKDPQRRYNLGVSAESEIVALQPKAPYLVTPKQVQDHVDLWSRANDENLPFLTYDPDPAAPPPQRMQPPVSSPGMMNMIQLAAEDMKAVTGIYDAALGMRSNETSGKAILARQQEGDVGTFVYVDNFVRGLRHTGRILVDLIPKIYDTSRVLRIIGEDGAINEVKLNQPMMQGGVEVVMNDLSVGTYDVTVDTGPSFATKRMEARDSMQGFLQAFPDAAPIIGDLFAKSMDWPNADKIAERLRTMLPPQIAQLEAQEAGENGEGPMAPPAPPPEAIYQQAVQETMQQPEFQMKQAQAAKAMADAKKAALEAQKAELELMMSGQPQAPALVETGPDPMAQIEMKVIEARAMEQVKLDAERVRMAMANEARLREQNAELGLVNETGSSAPADVLANAVASQGEAIRAGMEQIAAVLAESNARLAETLTKPKQVRVQRQPDGSMIGEQL